MASATTAAAAVTGAIHARNRRARRARALGCSPEAGGSRSGRTSRSVAASARVAALILSSTVFTIPP
jgi:hypothetical protein